jgi:hypothetical protein
MKTEEQIELDFQAAWESLVEGKATFAEVVRGLLDGYGDEATTAGLERLITGLEGGLEVLRAELAARSAASRAES